MYKYLITSLIFISSCSSFNWSELVVQGVKEDQSAPPVVKVKIDQRDRFLGRYRFVGANIERGGGDLVQLKECPKDSVFIEKNEFAGVGLSFRDKGQYFYDNIYFIDSPPPFGWMSTEDIKTKLTGNRLVQKRNRVRYEGKEKVYLEYLTTIDRTEDLLFYNSRVTIYRVNKLFIDELVPDLQGEVHCAYSFDSLSEEQKKTHVRSMGH